MSGSNDALCAELSGFCRSESFSEDGLKEIIERHGCTPNNPPIDNYNFFYSACLNEIVTEGILQCLLEYFPDAASAIAEGDMTPLHMICFRKNITLGMVQLLIDASPDSLRYSNQFGLTPLHCLCYNINADDEVKLEILKLLLEKCQESHGDSFGRHPLHNAARFQSAQFCRMLIGAYPGSERMTDNEGVLPFHCACANAHSITTVEYLYGIYPESINVADTFGHSPIHWAMDGIIRLFPGEPGEPEPESGTAVGILRFLLDCDPNVASQKNVLGELPLYYACHEVSSQQSPSVRVINDTLTFIKLVFNAYPEAIEDPLMTNLGRLGRLPGDIQLFINFALSTARLARNHREMTTGDEDDRLPLHVAIGDIDYLGCIKLLVNGNPAALQTPDSSGALPLHIASQYHESASVAEYLIGLDPNTLTAVDEDGNTALHYACRGANYDIITLLIEKYDAPFVSRQNVHQKLPIEILFECDPEDGDNQLVDRDGIDYLQSVFQLIRSCPETIDHMIPTNRI